MTGKQTQGAVAYDGTGALKLAAPAAPAQKKKFRKKETKGKKETKETQHPVVKNGAALLTKGARWTGPGAILAILTVALVVVITLASYAQLVVVNDKVVERRVMEKLPFMATENIMMESVKRGGNRQELHEALRVHSHAAAARVKLEGGQNDLIDRIAADPMFPLTKAEILEQLDPKAYTGRSGSQVTEFLRDVVRPLLEQYGNENLTVELRV